MWRAVAPLCSSIALLALGCEKKPATIGGPASSAPSARSPAPDRAPAATTETVEIPEVRVRPAAPTVVVVRWSTPNGTAVNDDAPFRVRWNRSDGLADAPSDVRSTGSSVKDGFRITVQPMAGAPNATLAGEIDLVVCDVATHSVCVPVRRRVELGFMSVKGAPPEAEISIPLPQAKAP